QHMRVPDSKALLLSVPPPSTQQRIVDKLKKMRGASDQLVTNYKIRLTMAAQLKKAILQEAFSGELAPSSSNPTAEAAE
ncbi:MAG: restriction endonuclease subunit S, partial [Nostoc sp.]